MFRDHDHWQRVTTNAVTIGGSSQATVGMRYMGLRVIDPRAKGDLRHYEQTVDPDEGSIVSHAAVGFYV